MSVDFVLDAELRDDKGKGASRRLRRAGKVPAVLYGADKKPKSITLDHINLLHHLEHEAFFSHILTINLGKTKEKVILKDLQRHPSKPVILHLDLQRIKETEKLRVHIPLHFLNEASAPGVKQGGLVGHNITEVEVSCLPKNLPEFLEVDLGDLELNASLHLSDIILPEGAELVELMHGEGHDQAVVNVHLPRVVQEVEEAAEVAATGEAEGIPEAEDNE